MIDYCGGGCPDLSRRDLKIAAFNQSSFVGTVCALNKQMEKENVTEIYDLVNDPLQYSNKKNVSTDTERALLQMIKTFRSQLA